MPSTVVMLVLLGVLTACGSTVAPRGQVVGGPGGSDPRGLGLGTGNGPDGPTGADLLAGGAVGGAAQAANSPGGAAATGSSPDSAAAVVSDATVVPGGAGAPAPGTAGGDIRLGLTYPDIGALATIFGEDTSDANPEAWLQRFVDHINKRGGVFGRRLKPVYFKADASEDASTLGQKACAAFTEDSKVDVVINTGVFGDTFPACLGRAGISMLDTASFVTDAADAARAPNKFTPSSMRADRLYRTVIELSGRAAKLPKGAVLGVLVEDCPWGSRVYQQHVKPTAERFGVAKVVRGTHKCLENLVQDLGPITNDVQRETLRFATEGVTHVVSVSQAEAFVVARFTQQASEQRYYPKYLVSSNAYPYHNSDPNAVVQIAQDALPNITGAGFLPMYDVGELARPDGNGQQAAQDRCRQADPTEGPVAREDNGRAKYFNRNNFYSYCDAFFVLKAVLEANGVRFGLADLTRAYRSVLSGRTPSAALTGGVFRVTEDRSDGAGLARPFGFDSGRKLFVYTGAAVQIP